MDGGAGSRAQTNNLRHVLDVGEHGVFQSVAGVCSTTTFSGAQVFGESENNMSVITSSFSSIYMNDCLINFRVLCLSIKDIFKMS